MKTERLTADNDGLDRAIALLSAGKTVAIPTETVYGLAADARNGQAVAGIFAAKDRPTFNPLIAHIHDLDAARELAEFNAQAERLATDFWPGALTLVLPLRASAGISPLVTAGLQTIGLRMPSNTTAREVLRRFNGPLAAPSANASGRVSPTSAAHVLDPDGGLDGRIGAVLDAGTCPIGVESTIVSWIDGRPTLLRHGGVPLEALEASLGQRLAQPAANPDKPSSPGQLLSHYAPQAPVRLNAASAEPGETYLAFGAPGTFTLSATGDLNEAAANLFDVLRQADRQGRPIAVAPIPETGLGAAINDRLRRAAAPRP
ncbi:L-threonylcarbamoyladenylate synthase [Paracoccus seriniphilus]|uniref:Threonylcarbamoyl-AMP synthase n=1 Tax=Paracoccus seriniphilus TaxID=184748 RepID=A0A239PS73_9RHOB|nr:L-threonylcarbamoyladenylate synthase [Paracoccus seriniphilus]WCR14306.1 threonylcarbamoyl-AMP synthase [Paracoccus seriniphilus]SNT72988.1 translation factor SUA5 [Paracoccus seriniphilus]